MDFPRMDYRERWRKIYAKDHGKKAFRFWVGPGPEPDKKKNQ